MQGGHNRKTVAQHMTGGSYRPARHGDQLASANAHRGSEPPTCPADLDGAARELWDVLVKQLVGILGPTDGPTLALLCVCYADLMRSAKTLATLEPGSTEHARLSRSIRSTNETYLKLAERFGLTPTDRERLPVPTSGTRSVGGVLHW